MSKTQIEQLRQEILDIKRLLVPGPSRMPTTGGGGRARELIYSGVAAEAIMYQSFGDVTINDGEPTPTTIETFSGIFEVPKDVACTIGYDQAAERWEVIAAPTWYPLFGPETLNKGTQSQFRIHGSDHTIKAKYGTLRAGKFWGLQWTQNQSGASAAGPRYATTIVDLATVGVAAWSNVANAAADDSAEAANSGAISHYLKATNPGFTLSAGLFIRGIQVDVKRRQLGTARYVDHSVRLVKGGVILGDDLATDTAWTAAPGYVSYGGAGSTWGLAWTAADLNLATFGVALAGQSDGAGTVDARVDAIRFKVFYSTVADDTTGAMWLGTEQEC